MSKRVLLVDDEQETRSVFESAIRSGGFEVVSVSSGKDALEKVQNHQFDLVILDQMMPDMSGNETLKAIKKDPRTKDLRIIILTNFAHDGLVQEAISAGASEYILKYQVSAEDLLQKVKQVLAE